MNAGPSGSRGVSSPGPTEVRLDRVLAMRSATDHESWQVVADWFTSPYWHAPRRLNELLEDARADRRPMPRSDACLAESGLSTAVRHLARLEVDCVATSLVDRFVFADAEPVGAIALAAGIRRGGSDAVVLELDSGHVVSASLAGVMAWIIAESLRCGFPEEVAHGYRSLLCGFVAVGPQDVSDRDAVALPLAALVPLPAGIAARSNTAGRVLAVPLPAYPLAAMLLPDQSATMFPTHEGLAALVDDPSLGDRWGRLEPIGPWAARWVEVRIAMDRPLARPLRATAGRVGRLLVRARDLVASTRFGSMLVRNGVDLGRVWSLLRRASSVGSNPWLGRSNRFLLDPTGAMDAQP